MTRISWDKVPDRLYETGLDRGVLYPKTKAAVPWNGLVAVDETGAESAVTYYMDGRPYLHMPKPKEFEATLKAITYPDEFSDLMGLFEAADGMYLDSQIGGSFDLSYRTLIGSPLDGTDHGYKIHLIYNAIATPDGISAQTISDSFSPTEFSWKVQALPVAIPGFRPTAHYIIDTRHIDPEKLAQIEALIYGIDVNVPGQEDFLDGGTVTDTTPDVIDGGLMLGVITDELDGGTPDGTPTGLVDGGVYNSTASTGIALLDGGNFDDPRGVNYVAPLDMPVADGGGALVIVQVQVDSSTNIQSLPNPQIIYDLLSYTENLIVTDNGDGTWTVEGPFDNISVNSSGFFQIDGINSTDTGNGTYTISTTIR